MCGRYSFAPSKKQKESQLAILDQPEDLEISFNIAPTHQGYVITNKQPGILQTMTWGLVPHWSRDGANGGKLINARAEGIEEKPSFREPIRSKRCLVPADSFYEWRTEPGRRKVPYRILPANGDLLFLAGIWDEWHQDNKTLRTFSILTTIPNAEMSGLHNRMPVILTNPADQQAWLKDQPIGRVLSQLHPPEDGYLTIYKVSEKLNAPGFDGPELHEAQPEELRLF